MNIETERLLLRPPQVGDAEAMHALWHEEFVCRYNVLTPMSVEQMRDKLKKDAQSGESTHIVLKSSGEVIGMIGRGEDNLRWDVNAVMIDYFLGQAHARKGYMTEALRAYIGHLFDRTEAKLVSARVFDGNAASQALLLGLGFTHEGTLRCAVGTPGGIVHDDRLYSLLRQEWEKRG